MIGIDETNTFQLQFCRFDETNTFQLKFCIYKIVGATGLGGLWAWHIRVTNLRCVILSGIKIVGVTGFHTNLRCV